MTQLKIISTYLTVDEKKKLMEKFEGLNISLSQYVKNILLSEIDGFIKESWIKAASDMNMELSDFIDFAILSLDTRPIDNSDRLRQLELENAQLKVELYHVPEEVDLGGDIYDKGAETIYKHLVKNKNKFVSPDKLRDLFEINNSHDDDDFKITLHKFETTYLDSDFEFSTQRKGGYKYVG